MTTTSAPTLAQYLPEPFTIGAPDAVGPLAVFPLFAPVPSIEYVAFASGIERGVRVHELEGEASVNDLTVMNPLDVGVLLYDGEEILGAQQNRTFDVSVLVAAGTKLDVPVSCVEAGRWDSTRHGEGFAPAPQAAYPELRKTKAREVRRRAAAGMEPRASQTEVWNAVAAKHDSMGTASPTGAMSDIFEQRRDLVASLRAGIKRRDDQVGMLVAIGGKFTVLDHAGRPEVFAALAEPLVYGYALDAIGAGSAAAPSSDAAGDFVARVCSQRLFESDGIGLGRDGRFESEGVAGAALLCGDELVQLTAFADDETPATPPTAARRARIRRPSHRRTG